MIASVVLILWPAFASANCCCKRLTQSESDSAQSCCSQTLGQPTSACCEANPTGAAQQSKQESESRCCGSPVAQSCDASGCCGSPSCCNSDDCQCSLRCCQAFDAIVAPSSSRDIDESSSYLFSALSTSAASAFELQTREYSFHSEFSFLRAQDHCTLICRWLK